MAKNDEKNTPKPVEKKPDTIADTEKVAATPTVKIPEKPESHKPPHSVEPPHKKRHGFRNFLLFVILLAAGAIGFLTLQLRQTEKLNSEAINKLQAAYDEKIMAVNNRVNVLDREIIGLKNRPIVEHAAGISENQLNQKLAALKNELEIKFGVQDETGNTEADESIKEENEAEEKVVTPSPQPVTVITQDEKKTQEILLASGAIIVRDLAEQGVNFAYEAEVLQILAQGNDLAAQNVKIVRSYANSGVIGKNKLIRNFGKIFAELNKAEIKPEPATENTKADTKMKIWQWLKQQIIAKKQPKKPVFKPQKDEVLALVNEGRLQEALETLKLSEKYAKVKSEPLQQWKIQVERYLEFDNAINAVIMNALANIRLKEMEH